MTIVKHAIGEHDPVPSHKNHEKIRSCWSGGAGVQMLLQLGNIVRETLTFWAEGASWDRRSRSRGGQRSGWERLLQL